MTVFVQLKKKTKGRPPAVTCNFAVYTAKKNGGHNDQRKVNDAYLVCAVLLSYLIASRDTVHTGGSFVSG